MSRVIRPPNPDAQEQPSFAFAQLEDLAAAMIRKARSRVEQLESESAELEKTLQERREKVDSEAADHRRRIEADLAELRANADAEVEAIRSSAREVGRRQGTEQGIKEGREEGQLRGYEEGLKEGRAAGTSEVERAFEERFDSEVGPSLKALRHLSEGFEKSCEVLFRGAREELIELAVDIARRVVKREVREVEAIVVDHVRQAVDHLSQRHEVVVHLHPDDVEVLEGRQVEIKALFRDLRTIRLEPDPSMERGGCEVVSGGASIDLKIETQLERVEMALLGRADEVV